MTITIIIYNCNNYNYCSIVGKRPKISAEPYTKWREPWRRRVHQCVVGPFKWTVLWKEPA